MFLSCRSLPLASINVNKEWNLHPWEFQEISSELRQSFKDIGILQPPIVQEVEEGQFTVVNGCKRLHFLKSETNLAEVNCVVINGNASCEYILDLLLDDRSNGRPLTLAEKCRFIHIASGLLDHETIVKNYLVRLGLKMPPSTILTLLNVLEQDITFIKDVHGGQIGEKMMMELLKLPEVSDRTVVVQLFRNLGMGDGKQRRFFTLLRDNAYRAGSTIAAYVGREHIQTILTHEQLNVPQKIHHLSVYLQQELTPSFLQAEEDFLQQVNQLQLPASHTLSHSPFFEKDEVTLSIKFKDLEECKSYLAQNGG